MKRNFIFAFASALLLFSLGACQGAAQEVSGNTAAASPTTAPAGESAVLPVSASGNDAPITVISREEGSGTRGAFTELFGVLDDNDADNTVITAEITNSTSVMMTSVAGNPHAIGYISLGSMNDTVKAAKIDGVDATVDNINNGTYAISRPFVIAVKEDISELAQDFIAFIMSTDGQNIIETEGYIRVEDTGAYAGSLPSGEITVAGSSSVSPVMEKLIEAYLAANTGAQIDLQVSDSSTGMNSAIDGVCDIGMSSRELKDTELASGLLDTTIAMDGIAVIVNNENAVNNLTKEQVKQMFTGEITNWSGIN